jgi:hypothetical protein
MPNSLMKTSMVFAIKAMILAIILLFLAPSVMHLTGIDQKYLLPGGEVYYAVNKSHRIFNSDVLILGDSVANQLCPPKSYHKKYVSLACNQSIGLVGYYVLFNNYLENNRNPKAVYLICHPEGFSNRLDQPFTYNYFLKPFYLDENSSYFTPEVKNILSDFAYSRYLSIPLIRYTNVSQILNAVPGKYDEGVVDDKVMPSDLTIEYLKMMRDIATKRGIVFKVLAPPLDVYYKKFDYSRLVKAADENGLAEVFSDYFDIRYLDSSLFRDQVHFKDPSSLGDNPLNLKF